MGVPPMEDTGETPVPQREHVVHVRHGQRGMQGELALAVRVEKIGYFADAGFLFLGRFWKREGLETTGFDVDRVVADTEVTA